MTFKDVALAIAKESDATVMAAQVDGLLRINPSAVVVDENTILFALAADQKALDVVAADGTADVPTWLAIFQANRRRGDAAQVMAQFQVDLHFGWRYKDAGRESSAKPNSFDDGTDQAKITTITALGINTPKSGLPSMRSPHPSRNSPPALEERANDSPARPRSSHNEAAIFDIAKTGDHVVLALVAQDNQKGVYQGMWQQVEIILKNLRTVTDTPVIVISAEEDQSTSQSKVKMIIADYRNRRKEAHLYAFEGDALKSTVLSQAGVSDFEELSLLHHVHEWNTSVCRSYNNA